MKIALVCLMVGGLITSCSSAAKPTAKATQMTESSRTLKSSLQALTSKGSKGATTQVTQSTPGGGASTSTTGAPSSGQLSGSFLASPTCSALSASQVGTALGESLSAPISSGAGKSVLCTFNSTSKAGQTVTVEFQGGTTTSQFVSEQSDASKTNKVTPVPGLGSGAFSFSVSGPQGTYNILYVLEGSTVVSVSSTAGLSAQESLVRTLFG